MKEQDYKDRAAFLFANIRVDANGCWNWQKATRSGYGAIKINSKTLGAHRVSYELRFGKIPEGLFVCHKCDNKRCINPSHLFVGTAKDNMQDCKKKGRLVMPKFTPFKKGQRPSNAKLTDSVVIDIKLMINDGVPLIEISRDLDVPYQTIKDIKGRRSYANILPLLD